MHRRSVEASAWATPVSDEDLRRQLEGGEVLLERTRARYRQLLPALSSPPKLRALHQLARETARDDDQLRITLTRAVKHAENASWPKGPTSTLIREVRDAEPKFRELERRVNEALTSPHRVTKELRDVVLEALLREPIDLDRDWARVEHVDPALIDYLRETEKLPSTAAALIKARRELESLTSRFIVVKITDAERKRCFEFARARETDGAARLPSSPRNALLMLANELSGQPESRPPLVGGRTQVLEWANLADKLQNDDWKAVRAWLRSLKPRRLLPNPTNGPELLVDLL